MNGISRITAHVDNGRALSWPDRVPTRPIGVVLVHGITGTPAEMRPVARHLEQIGCRVAVPMLAGHGAGHRELLATTWEDWLTSVRDAVEMIVPDTSAVIVAGLSAGGLLAVRLAVEDRRVSGVAALSLHFGIPGAHISRRDFILSRLLSRIPVFRRYCYFIERPPYGLKDERLQRRITRAIEASQVGETAQYGLFRTYATTLHQVNQLEDAVRRCASQLRCPTLILHSLEDTMLSPDNAAVLYRLIGAEDKTLTFIDGCDHVMTVDLRKELVAEQVGAFARRVGALSARAWADR